MQRCCNEFSGVLSVVAALFHRLLVSFISGLMGGHPVSNDQNPPTVVLLAATDKGNGGESMTPLKSQLIHHSDQKCPKNLFRWI